MVTNMDVKEIHAVRCRCSNGQQGRILEIRVSDSSANPLRLYYKCKACFFFSWVKEEDLTRYGRQRLMCEAYGGEISTQIETELMVQRKQIRQLQKMMKIMIIIGLLILVIVIKN